MTIARNFFVRAALAAFAAAYFALAAVPADAADTVRLSGIIRGLTGNFKVYVYLYDAPADGWFGSAPYKKLIIYPSSIRDGRADYAFMLSPGRYAVAAFEDTNQNLKFDFGGVFNLPREPYGFYRRFTPIWRFPGFDDVSFELSSNKVDANIPMYNRRQR